MASYSSYKKIRSDSLTDNLFGVDNLEVGAGNNYGILYVYSARGFQCHECSNAGGCVCQACGRCCQWTVPANTSTATFEIWSGGGGGPGINCCNCCHDAIAGAGGNYAIRTIDVTPSNTYTVCAGGTWPCEKSHTCTAGQGCRSYVTGTGLSNFCVTGGCGGNLCANPFGPNIHNSGCANCNICGIFGADFGIMGSVGGMFGKGYHHCQKKGNYSGQAPFIGRVVANANSEAYCSCGCYVNWPSGGGQAGITFCYEGDARMCCAGGSGQGGSGIVKITYS